MFLIWSRVVPWGLAAGLCVSAPSIGGSGRTGGSTSSGPAGLRRGVLVVRHGSSHRQFTGASGDSAGPEITSPVVVKREPWHGQSQVRSAGFHPTTQPMCVQIAERSVSEPSRSR